MWLKIAVIGQIQRLDGIGRLADKILRKMGKYVQAERRFFGAVRVLNATGAAADLSILMRCWMLFSMNSIIRSSHRDRQSMRRLFDHRIVIEHATMIMLLVTTTILCFLLLHAVCPMP